MRKIIPSNNRNKTEMSVTILLAAEEILNELMRLENDEDTRLSATLSLYNEVIITSTTMTDTNNLIILGSGPAGPEPRIIKLFVSVIVVEVIMTSLYKDNVADKRVSSSFSNLINSLSISSAAKRIVTDISVLFLLLLGIIFLISLWTYNPSDQKQFEAVSSDNFSNSIGLIGAYLSFISYWPITNKG